MDIETLLSRSVENIYPSKEYLEARLKKGKVSLYLGIDPTGPCLHIGHAIPLMKLRQFQQLGHKVILLMGDFTGMIGDPTDKSATRKQLTPEQVRENLKGYKEQASKILDFGGKNPVEIRFNNDWLGKLTFKDVVELAANFTVQQMLARDMFEKRMKEGKPIGLHEFLYPLMQGYDCVAMNVDGEIGGNDQTFNMLAGRTLMKAVKDKEKFVMTTKLLTDPTGKKMGKTEGNMITLVDTPHEMYGKVMSWTDGMIFGGFELCTEVPMDEIKKMEKEMKKGANPRDYKARLAHEIVTFYHGVEAANKAGEEFKRVFQDRLVSVDAEDLDLDGYPHKLVDVMVQANLATSKSDARRKIQQNSVSINGKKIATDNLDAEITLDNDRQIIRVGRNSRRIRIDQDIS